MLSDIKNIYDTEGNVKEQPKFLHIIEIDIEIADNIEISNWLYDNIGEIYINWYYDCEIYTGQTYNDGSWNEEIFYCIKFKDAESAMAYTLMWDN